MAERSLDVLIFSQFFTPEMGAPAARFHDLGRLLVERGHRVTVVTGFPNSPSGRIPPEYRGRWRQRETIDGISVLRGWVYASPSLSKLSKGLALVSFAASASLRALFGRLRADVVIATSPPPTVAIPAMLAARRLRAPLLFDVRDIWPEAIANSGDVESGTVIRVLGGLERAIYRASSAITAVTEGKRERLIEKGVPEAKLTVAPNGVDLSRFRHVDREPARALLRSHGIEAERFVVLYAGVFNPAQGLDVLLDAAAHLRDGAPDVAAQLQFALVGAGSERTRLERRVADENLGQWVRFLPEQGRDDIPGLLCAAGAVAVTLRPRRDSHTVPSKLYEAMASGRPVLVSADDAPAEILREADAGLASAAGDAEGLAASIERLLAEPGLADSFGRNGVAYAARFDRGQLAAQFEALLLRLA